VSSSSRHDARGDILPFDDISPRWFILCDDFIMSIAYFVAHLRPSISVLFPTPKSYTRDHHTQNIHKGKPSHYQNDNGRIQSIQSNHRFQSNSQSTIPHCISGEPPTVLTMHYLHFPSLPLQMTTCKRLASIPFYKHRAKPQSRRHE
jgi:hypothetical protein